MLAPMPAMLLYALPNMLVLFAVYGWLPRGGGVEDWLTFGLNVVLFAIYTAVAYIPYLLLKSRFERERVYAELACSHRELAEAHRQLEERAAQDRELAIWRERARLARELHDTLGHSLALMAVKLDAAQRLRGVDAARADHEIEVTQGIARAALADLRAAIANVRSPALSRTPLGEVLARQARELAGTAGWQVTYEIAPGLGALDDATYEALLRIGGEALANVERHAHARSVRLALRREREVVVLRVEDDGCGILTTNPPTELAPVLAPLATAEALGGAAGDFDGADRVGDADEEITSPSGHYGIRGMRERASTLGGHFAIGPGADGRGTRVEARLPVE
jgi:signal transduction histidine kinase